MNELVELIRQHPDYVKVAGEFMKKLRVQSGPDFLSQLNRVEIQADITPNKDLLDCKEWLKTWNLKRLIDPEDMSFTDSAICFIKPVESVSTTTGEYLNQPFEGDYYIRISPGAKKKLVCRAVDDLYKYEPGITKHRRPKELKRDLRIYHLHASGKSLPEITEILFPNAPKGLSPDHDEDSEYFDEKYEIVKTAYQTIKKRILSVKSRLPL